jgi:hypothetical protein
MNRYLVVGSETECEPGSNNLVLANRLGGRCGRFRFVPQAVALVPDED